MLHVTCDVCGKALRTGEDHHVVKIEVFAAQEPVLLTEADLDEDQLEAVSDLLRAMEEDEAVEQAPPSTQSQRFDLCPRCCKRYLRDPLGRDVAQKFDFSEN